jgi:acyl carrier protein
LSTLRPLESPEIASIDHTAGLTERFMRFIPILGWGIADYMWGRRTRHIVLKIERQLEEREKPPESIWGSDPERIALAKIVCKILAEELSWPNDHFIPEDPVNILLWSHVDGLDDVEAVLQLEEKLGVKITEEQTAAWSDGTLGEMVDCLLEMKSQLKP